MTRRMPVLEELRLHGRLGCFAQGNEKRPECFGAFGLALARAILSSDNGRDEVCPQACADRPIRQRKPHQPCQPTSDRVQFLPCTHYGNIEWRFATGVEMENAPGEYPGALFMAFCGCYPIRLRRDLGRDFCVCNVIHAALAPAKRIPDTNT